jgi:hypothetical protein
MSKGVTAIVLSTSKNLSADVAQLMQEQHIIPEQKMQIPQQFGMGQKPSQVPMLPLE